MKSIEIKCDNCGKASPYPRRRPKTWYALEDASEVMRTGAMDFCSLACVAAWAQDKDVAAALPHIPEPEE